MDESGLAKPLIRPSAGSRLRSGNNIIGESWLVEVSTSGTLAELNDFLSKFYQLDILHRINSMTLKPENEPRTSKPVRSGLIMVKMKLEFLSLQTGKNRDGFDDFRKNLANAETNYQPILRRNIFGPANSEPVISASNKTTIEGRGKPYSFPITAKDANKNDLLKFELAETSVEDAVLTQAKGTKRATFEMPEMPPGTYKFKVKVSDNGFPVKSSTKEFTVTVDKKPPAESKTAERPVSKPEEVDYIQLVKVTGITSNRDGKLEVWVSVGPTGERHRLSVGESFQLGDKEYKLKSIENGEATFTGDGKTFVARPDHEKHGAFEETEQSASNKGERL